MAAADLVRRGRAAAARYMAKTGTVVELGRNTGALDPVTYEPIMTIVYSGPGRVQTYEPHERDVEVGGGSVTVQRYSVHLPVGPFAPEVGDQIEVIASPLDPNLVGRLFLVRALMHKSAATAYRLGVDDTDDGS
ncbi:DUF6093 family protein [Isoptericola sp. G70]|uniref:DUF6093 family protein n=1 Tax=Isoptericola sp. G70 TaxID=3376633 RepID=UPI003A80219C